MVDMIRRYCSRCHGGRRNSSAAELLEILDRLTRINPVVLLLLGSHRKVLVRTLNTQLGLRHVGPRSKALQNSIGMPVPSMRVPDMPVANKFPGTASD
jgi:hypothetical protein